jgi:hypothetical protein
MIPRDRSAPADGEFVDLVADFLYDWQDTGKDPSRAARRLLERLRRKLCHEADGQSLGDAT